MSVKDALRLARKAGVEIGLVGDDLMLTAAVRPPGAVLDLLARNKSAIVSLLRPAPEDWSAEDWRAFYDEQSEVARREFGLAPDQADNHAFILSLVGWMSRNGADPEALDFVRQIIVVDPRDLVVGPTRDYEGHPLGTWDGRCESALLAAATALDAIGIQFKPEFPEDFEKNRGA
ncbi:MAG: hypothetical protein U0900_06635 [Myxococcota bacterium]